MRYFIFPTKWWVPWEEFHIWVRALQITIDLFYNLCMLETNGSLLTNINSIYASRKGKQKETSTQLWQKAFRRNLRMEKTCTWKYSCQTLALPRLKGWSSWEISCRCRGPSISLSTCCSSGLKAPSFLVNFDCLDSRFPLARNHAFWCRSFLRYLSEAKLDVKWSVSSILRDFGEAPLWD